MIISYVEEALRRAEYNRLEDESFVAEVTDLPGVIAIGLTYEQCRTNLAEVVEVMGPGAYQPRTRSPHTGRSDRRSKARLLNARMGTCFTAETGEGTSRPWV